MKTIIRNATDHIKFGNNDDEHLPISQCVCGAKFTGWNFIISIYEDNPTECPECGRKFFFTLSIQVFQVQFVEEEIDNG